VLLLVSLYRENSAVYLWTWTRSVGHRFVFDAVDSIHLLQKENGSMPSLGLLQYSQVLLNFLCNVYDNDTDAGQRCCASRQLPRRPSLSSSIYILYLFAISGASYKISASFKTFHSLGILRPPSVRFLLRCPSVCLIVKVRYHIKMTHAWFPPFRCRSALPFRRSRYVNLRKNYTKRRKNYVA